LKALIYKVRICTSSLSPKSAGQVRIRRSLGQGHGHTSSKTSAVILPLLCFGECTNTTPQMVSTLHHPGPACNHDDGKFHASYLSHSWFVCICRWLALD